METKVIAALIALLGVIISVTISYLISYRKSIIEMKKIKTTIEQKFNTELLKKRLEFYPLIFEIITNAGKKIKRIIMETPTEHFTKAELIEFYTAYENLNSKYGVLFSSLSGSLSSRIRKHLIESNNKLNIPNTADIPLDTLKKLRANIQNLEFSLKQDIGIYIVEFKDANRELILNNYNDVLRQRKKLH